MALAGSVRVKISSEAAEWIALTPVVAREMPVQELIGMMLGVTGKDPQRVRELLLRGTLVSGGSRFRWQGWDAEPDAIAAALAVFPDADPSLEFAPARCETVVLRGGNTRLEFPRAVAEARRAFHRRSFWQVLMEFAATARPRYREYSYKEKADLFVAEVSAAAAATFQAQAGLLKYSSLEASVGRNAIETAEFYVSRPAL